MLLPPADPPESPSLTATGAASRIRMADPEDPNAGNAASAAPATLTSSWNESVNLLVLLEGSLLPSAPVTPTTHRAADSAGKAMLYVANAVQHSEPMQSPLQCAVLPALHAALSMHSAFGTPTERFPTTVNTVCSALTERRKPLKGLRPLQHVSALHAPDPEEQRGWVGRRTSSTCSSSMRQRT